MQLVHLVAVAFAAPAPVRLSVSSPLSADAALIKLREAIDSGQYSSPGLESSGFYRLGGVVTRNALSLTARPYVIPWVRAGYGAMTLGFRGAIRPAATGSEIAGTVIAPVGRGTLLVLTAILVAFAVGNVLSHGTAPFILASSILVPTFLIVSWTVMIRWNQRMALRRANEVARLLSSILMAERAA